MTLENAENPGEEKQVPQNSSDEAEEYSGDSDQPLPSAPLPAATDPCCNHKEITFNIKKDWIDNFASIVEGVALLVLIVYTIATIAIWSANKKAADAANTSAEAAKNGAATAAQTMRIDERAWLRFSDDPNTPFMKGQPISIPVHITNIGRTPAEHLWWAVYTSLVPMGKEPDLPSSHIVPNDTIYNLDRKETIQVNIPHEEMVRGLLYPAEHDDTMATILEKVPRNGEYTIQPKPFVSPEWDRFAQSKSYIIAFGEVWYLDVFGVTHWTRFCVSKSATGGNTSRKCIDYAKVDNNTE